MSILALLAACTTPVPDTPPDTDGLDDTAAPSGLDAPLWEPIDVVGIEPVWGVTSVGPYMLGGVDGATATLTDVVSVAITDDGVEGTPVGSLTTGRFCGCALHDTTRDELVVVGGRNASFREEMTAERVDLSTGTSTALDGMGAADHPVGCWAAYSEDADLGWVFGGAGGMALSGDTWRWDPEDGTFTELSIAGPSPRYDPGVVTLPDGGVLLVGGMDETMRFEDSPVWRFDPGSETWEELAVTSAEAPPGRRFPFVGLDPAGTHLVYGYGSDSPQGLTVRRDLWSFELATGVWSKLQVDGDKPEARSFAGIWPGPEGSVGVLAFGVDGNLDLYDDAWVLWVP